MQKTPISVISGFLGAGKTTLLRKIIAQLDRKFAIIMNEFGEIGIDTHVIQGKNVDVVELAGGCVCCSLIGEFQDAVREVIEKYHPEIIIVETTGVAEPDALILDISDNMQDVRIDSVVTVADADGILRFSSIGRTGAVQIEMADIVLLNKVDLVAQQQLEIVKQRIREFNKKAPIIETTYCDVDIDLLFSLEIEHHINKVHPSHRTRFDSFTYMLTKPVDREAFEEMLLKLPSAVYRLKGFVDLEEEGSHFLNYVAGRWELEQMDAEQKVLVFIGEDILSQKPQIVRMLESL